VTPSPQSTDQKVLRSSHSSGIDDHLGLFSLAPMRCKEFRRTPKYSIAAWCMRSWILSGQFSILPFSIKGMSLDSGSPFSLQVHYLLLPSMAPPPMGRSKLKTQS
jgi:hypothetical protein